MAEMAKLAYLVKPGEFEFREYPVPEIDDDQILIRVEGCGVCGTDGHEYKRDPFGLCPVVLGHEGSGEIIKLGRNVKTDSAGKPVKLGDKLVTCIIPCGKCSACKNTPARTNLCEHCGVYGLFPDDDIHLNGYFATHMVIRKGSTFFNVTGMTLDQRMLVEPAAVAVHAVERAKTTGLLKFNTTVLIQGCGPIGLMVMAVVRTLGIENIIALDGNDNRLEIARTLGASHTFNFTKYPDFGKMLEEIKAATDGLGAEFAFQCTGVPAAHASVWKMDSSLTAETVRSIRITTSATKKLQPSVPGFILRRIIRRHSIFSAGQKRSGFLLRSLSRTTSRFLRSGKRLKRMCR